MVQMDAVLRDCLIYCITLKRIELQTWDWSSFEDIFEKSMQNCNGELYSHCTHICEICQVYTIQHHQHPHKVFSTFLKIYIEFIVNSNLFIPRIFQTQLCLN